MAIAVFSFYLSGLILGLLVWANLVGPATALVVAACIAALGIGLASRSRDADW